MSVITDWEATPNRLEMLYSYVASKRASGVMRAHLNELFSPDVIRRGDASSEARIPGRVADEAKNLGLIDEEDGRLTARSLESMLIRNLLFERILGPDASSWKQSNVGQAASWFLMRHPEAPLSWSDSVKEQVIADIPGSNGFDLANRSSWQQFVYWARYFGFATVITIDSTQQVIPDPTALIASLLPQFPVEPEPLPDSVARLGRLCPILETGIVRESVEHLAAVPRKARELSPATSRALRVLELQGAIQLDLLADSDSTMLLTDERTLRRVSHLRRGRK